jgi:hypothetical protein
MTAPTPNSVFYAPPKTEGDTAAYGVSDGEYIAYCTFIGDRGSEALKLSRNVNDATIYASVFSGGVEDCVDILGSKQVSFSNCMFARGRAKRDCTIKGGATGISFVNCWNLRYIKAGDCTIYERVNLLPPVSNCRVHNPDGRKTIVLCLNSDPFIGDVINIRVPKLIVRAYFWARWKFFK